MFDGELRTGYCRIGHILSNNNTEGLIRLFTIRMSFIVMPPTTPGVNGPVSSMTGNGSKVSFPTSSNQAATRKETSSLGSNRSLELLPVSESAVCVSVLPNWWKAEPCEDEIWVSYTVSLSLLTSESWSRGTVVRAPSWKHTRGGVPIIYSPNYAWSTPDAAAAYDAEIAAPEGRGRMFENVAFREGWKIGFGSGERWIDVFEVFTGTGAGSQAQRDAISNAILANSHRKGLLVTSPDKRGRL